MAAKAVDDKELLHFTHNHPLSLIHLQSSNNHKDSDNEDEDEDHEDEGENVFLEEDQQLGQCKMCLDEIWSFHLCYYSCKSCDYSLHKFCAELPINQQNHPLHPDHNLRLSLWSDYHDQESNWRCFVCKYSWENTYSYHCSICNISMDIFCATMSEQKISHPSHPHQLQPIWFTDRSICVACGEEHRWDFFQCTTCPWFWVNLDCILLPPKLLIQNHTNESFTHSHPLSLAYSFPYSDINPNFYYRCRVCDDGFVPHLWLYKCDRCRYYVHVNCATSKKENFMSIFQLSSLGKTSKNYKEDEHPNLLHFPIQDEGESLVKHYTATQKEVIREEHDGEMLNHSSHQHPLVLFNKQTLANEKQISLHDPLKRVQLLCDGCVKPITAVPFYKCSKYVDEQCNFILHQWCTKLPAELNGFSRHHEHTLSLQLKVPSKFLGVFTCAICMLPCNGFAYGCITCDYYVDLNCAFVPEVITHDAHPNHLLSRLTPSIELLTKFCKACQYSLEEVTSFYCRSCDFYIGIDCALSLPRVTNHRFDKHSLSLRYQPAENHISEYFCEICEDEFNPFEWFYHCNTCDQSIHASCAPLILQLEQATYAKYKACVHRFLNVKFGGVVHIKNHPHPLVFLQGLESNGQCIECGQLLQYEMIIKCLVCQLALHYDCIHMFINKSDVKLNFKSSMSLLE